MTSGGFDCNITQTEQVATTMTTATTPVEGLADRTPEPPSAGSATGAVIDFMQRLAEAMTEFTRSTHALGEQLSGTVDTYRRDDDGVAGNINSVPIPGPPR